MEFFDNTLISKRIRLLTIAVIIGFMATASVFVVNEINHDQILKVENETLELTAETAKLNHLAFEAQNVAASFLITQNPSFSQEYVTITRKLREEIEIFLSVGLVADHEPLTRSGLEALGRLDAYTEHMKALFEKWKKAGATEETGIHGRFRGEAHAIEAILGSIEADNIASLKSQVLLLTMRRAEKDFIQRYEDRYVVKSNKAIEELKNLSRESFSASTNQAIQTHLANYKTHFSVFVELRQNILLDEEVMRREASEIVKSIEALRTGTIDHLNDHNQEVIKIRNLFTYFVFGTVILTALFVIGLARQVSRSISKPMNKLITVMQAFLRNDYSVSIPSFAKDTEFGDMSAILVKMQAQETAKLQAEQKLQDAFDSLDERVRERTQELENANEELNQFAYVISHDIKAPLRAIHNYSDFLVEDLSGKLEEEQQGYLDSMAKAVSEGEQMIEDVLTLSRIGRADTDIQVVDILEIINSVKDLLALGDDCEFVCSGQWPPVPTNPTLLKQVLSNLIANGFKFNKSTYKRVEVYGGERGGDDETPRHIEIRIEDNGIGIDEKYRENIFKMFHRLHTKKEYDGTGIGLAIVKKAMLELRGTISIEDAAEEGTCFVLCLPLELDMKGERHERAH